MHSDADGSGAPKGERNGNYKHGRYAKRWPPGAVGCVRPLICSAN